MNKRILPIIIAVLMCLTLFPVSAAASSNITATYSEGVVTVTGTGFASGTSYSVRVVDITNKNITAMSQAIADGNGSLSASITTGALGAWTNYTVYVNKPDGTLAASYTYSTESGGNTGNGGNSGGGWVVTVPDTDVPGADADTEANTTYLTLVTKYTIDAATGIVTAKVDESDFLALLAQVKAAEAAGKKVMVIIKVEAPAGTNSVILEFPRILFNRLAAETNAAWRFDAAIGTLTFKAKTVAGISSEADTGSIFTTISKIKASALSAAVLAKVGDKPAYEFLIKAGITAIQKFTGGYVEISIPYTILSGEKRNSVIVYYIDNSENFKMVRGRYIAATGTVHFKTTHFSMFAVGYNEVNFNDVASNAWYNEAIGFMSARGIVNGVGGGRFAHGSSVTRADFLIMVMNSFGIDPDTTITGNFSDAGDKYYTKYLATAKRLGLVYGLGDNKYGPEATISRQDMFVTLYRILGQLDELPTGTSGGKVLGSFDDSGKTAAYANDAMKLFVVTGTIVGDGVNITPRATSSRAEAAQVLYNLFSK